MTVVVLLPNPTIQVGILGLAVYTAVAGYFARTADRVNRLDGDPLTGLNYIVFMALSAFGWPLVTVLFFPYVLYRRWRKP